MNQSAAVCAIFMMVISSAPAEPADRVKQTTDVILKLCLAEGAENIQITKKDGSIEVAGTSGGGSVEIKSKESTGLVGGISKEITALSAQQASEARSCTQKYLTELVNMQ